MTTAARRGVAGPIHFWVPEGPSAEEVLDWDPDAEPERFASGTGHNMLELFRRLSAVGAEVTLGADVTKGAALAVLFGWSAFDHPKTPDALRAVERVRGRFVLIRSDVPLAWRFPVTPLVEFMPNQTVVRRPWQRCILPLPQRGLIPRNEERKGAVRSVALKANPENVPQALREPWWEIELASRGIRWLLDVPSRTDGSDQRWHDFSDVDAVICLRPASGDSDLARNPATRLVNAWHAGAIPLVGPEPGYRELAQDGVDAFFVADAQECLDVLDRLARDRALLSSVETAFAARAALFSRDRILEQWREALVAASAVPAAAGWRAWARTARARAVRVRREVRRRRSSLTR